MPWRVICGVDYSGAKVAGRTAWLADCRPARGGRLRLLALDPLGKLAGADDRAAVNAELVRRVRASRNALWALNFPFGLPAEALPVGQSNWAAQFRHLKTWGELAYACGVACVERAVKAGHRMHVRRATDCQHRTPFDSYHYRIIYQTFYGMRDVLGPLRREAGDVWATSSEKGGAYLFTADGLFLKTLGGDVRTTPLWRFPKAERGMSVDGVSWEDECFFPTINQKADGEIYVITGKEHVSINHLTGLESVRRQDWGTITVTPAMLAGLPATLVEPVQKQVRRTLEVAAGGKGPTVDGKLEDWPTAETAWARIDPRTKASLWITADRIHAAFRTESPKLLDNSASDPRYLFKFGGALDLSFGAKWNPGNLQENNPYRPGDCRLLVAKIKGKPTAVLYRPVDPKAPKGEECVFESPIGREVFASVKDITSELEFAEDGAGNYEISVPLATVLRVEFPKLGKQDRHEDKTVILGDLGIIRGNGSQNVQRACWNSLDTWMTSDIPTEARWRSINWGVLKLVRP